ncbi:MAG: sensor histidine kinase, partial [Clostridia bacterium]|nr:sensor histidine kinase [Clostridia bacterium]
LYSVEKDIWEILYNLTSNAIRYGKKGGWVKIRLKKNEISVLDNGIGIDEMHLPHLFEQFYRVDQSRDPSVRGTGLGLSIVRTLTEINGGNVSVKSEPGKGSEFTVTFTKNTQSD